MEFNDRLKKLRLEKKVTQGQVAKQCGMVLRTYQRLENEGAKPHFDSLLAFANYYNISVDWLMGRTGDRVLHSPRCGDAQAEGRSFQDRLKKLRLEKNMTQSQAAERCNMGLRAYQRLENEGAKPHFDNLMGLADTFHVSVDWLMGRTDDRELHQLSL